MKQKEIAKVLELIKEAYNIDTKDHAMFQNFDIAKEYFVRKLYYAKNEENIFYFKYPNAIKTKKMRNVYPDFMFELKYNDIMSLMNDTPVTEGIVDFVQTCFNCYIQHTEPNDNSPSIVFGTSFDIENIVPSDRNYVYLHSYFTSSINKSKQDKKNMIKELKHWYHRHDNKFLS